MSRFDGHVALVTGASKGIGLSTAARLVAEGARVVITGRSAESLDRAVASLGGPRHAIAVSGRTDDAEHRADTVHRAMAEFGRLDLLVNNAAVNPVFGSVLELDPAAIRKVFEANLLATIGWTRQVCDAWLTEHGGSVVNVAAVAGLRPIGGIGAYGMSKAAMILLTKQLAEELAPGIRVNAVAPAVVQTRFARKLYENREQEVAAAYPLQRLGTPEDIAGAITFLASPDAAWITGQTIVVDGGLTLGCE